MPLSAVILVICITVQMGLNLWQSRTIVELNARLEAKECTHDLPR